MEIIPYVLNCYQFTTDKYQESKECSFYSIQMTWHSSDYQPDILLKICPGILSDLFYVH